MERVILRLSDNDPNAMNDHKRAELMVKKAKSLGNSHADNGALSDWMKLTELKKKMK